ncbi:MAG: ATP-binding protein [Flavitalea sp.]
MRKAKLDTKEQTLQEVSRDIHDNISLGLTLSKLHLHALNEEQSSTIHDKLGLSIHLIGEAIHNLSDISKSLNADSIKEYGLIRAIENEIDNLNSTKLYDIYFEIQGAAERYPPRIEIALFRILQEALKNIIRHSQATCIEIIIVFTKTQIQIIIEDNGRGFLINDRNITGGAGLKNMRDRALMIRSHFEITSTIGTGTKINITVPLKIKDEKRPTYNG